MPDFTALRELAAIIDGIPEERIDMSVITRTKSCGTVGCAIGWYAQHPAGKARGLSVFLSNESSGDVYYRGQHGYFADVAVKLFGLTYVESSNLFGPHVGFDQKGEFRRRIIRLFNQYGQPVSRSYREATYPPPPLRIRRP